MKKFLLFIFLTVFSLIVPNFKAFAATGDVVLFNNRTYTFDNQSYIYDLVPTYSARGSYGEGFFVFSILVDEGSLPYTATVYFSDNSTYTCSFSSASIDYVTNSNVVLSVSCPINWNNNQAVTKIRFFRASTGSATSFTMPGSINFYTSSDTSIINNSINNATSAVNDVNDSINNDSVTTNTENSSTASSWASQSASDSVVSDMVLMPITLLNAFSTGFNGSCQSYNLGSLYGTNLTLPCINIQNYLGSTLWGIIDVLMSGFLIYGIGKKFVRVFNDFTNLKDSQVDELYGGGN